MTPTQMPEKAFPVSWDQFHRDARALAWRLNGAGPFAAIVTVTRGGLVPAAIVARELDVRLIETICISSYDHIRQGELKVLKGVASELVKMSGGGGKGVLIVDDLVDTGKTAQVVRGLKRRRSWALTGTPIENKPEDLIKDPYVLEFTGLPEAARWQESDLESVGLILCTDKNRVGAQLTCLDWL